MNGDALQEGESPAPAVEAPQETPVSEEAEAPEAAPVPEEVEAPPAAPDAPVTITPDSFRYTPPPRAVRVRMGKKRQ